MVGDNAMTSTLTSGTGGATGPDMLIPAGAVSLPVISDPTDPSLLNVHPLAYGVLTNGDIAVVGEADTEFPVVQATVSLFDSTGSLLWREPLAGIVSRTATTVLTAAVATLPTGQFWVGLNVQDGLAPLDDAPHHQLTFTRYAQDGTNSVDPFPAHPTTSNLTAIGLPDGGAYFFSGNLFAGRGLGPLYQHPPAPTYVYAYSAANTFIAFDGSNGVLEHYASPYDFGALWNFTTGDANPATATAIAAIGGGRAALVWTDTTGESFLAIADTVAQTLSTPLMINQGGPSGPDHVVALWDGTFVVQLPGEYETFDSTGATGGGWHGIDTTLEGLNLDGQVFGIGVDSSGNFFERAYTIGSVSTSQTGSDTVSTSDATYTVPAGVTTIHLTGADQTVTGNNAGDTFWSNDTGNVLIGGTGNDTFHLGRGGDWATGDGGNDTFAFAAIPWAGGHITDFSAGDMLDLSVLMSTTSDTGTDGFADGYLKITADSSGNAQVWADYHIPGNDGWWLVETLDGVAPSSLTHTGDVITVGSSSSGGGGPTDVSTAAPNYTAPASVTAITLAGSQQTIDASATNGVTINSNDSGNVLTGGPGDDTFHLGRGGDTVTGGAGADTFAYAAIPWAGGTITDFNAAQGDKVDLTGLLANASFTGSDPFAAGYLKYGADVSGNAQILADYNLPGNDGWWLVATLDGVSTSSLHYANGMIT
jgi:hypothetical protein